MIKKKYSLSANIGSGMNGCARYIITPNAKRVADEIVSQYEAGVHSFTIIGTYGTGKSCFLLEFEQELSLNGKCGLLGRRLPEVSGYDIINIVGHYDSFERILGSELACEYDGVDVLEKLANICRKSTKANRMLVVAVDEFGKVLEYASKNDADKELYFFQQVSELVNRSEYNVLLLTTLHQNFSVYVSKLDMSQKKEWKKVKGRFKEIVFAEPVEQLLYLAAESISCRPSAGDEKQIRGILEIAKRTKFISDNLNVEVMKRLYPLDAFSAAALTTAIQRYGQNERSLFSFLNSRGYGSLSEFRPSSDRTYSLCDVYDYIVRGLYSDLNDSALDAMGWEAIRVAVERVETGEWNSADEVNNALKTVKAIGLLNLLGNAGFGMTKTDLTEYMASAMSVSEPECVLDKLIDRRIIRFAEYKRRFILYEGTDVNIEEELERALQTVPPPLTPVDDLRVYFNDRVAPVKAYYYHRGTPRYFEYCLYGSPLDIVPSGEVDGYVELIFPTQGDSVESIRQFSANCSHAIIFAVFNKTDEIIKHLHKIRIYNHIIEKVLIDKSDKVALREIIRLKNFEQTLMNKAVKESLFAYDGSVIWLYRGTEVCVGNQRQFNALLSDVCNDIYSLTPSINNELINRQKLSGNISAARVKYLQALTANGDKPDFGFDVDKFPPEKTIYFSLLKKTGLHVDGVFSDSPMDDGIRTLWNACEDFLSSSREKPRKVSELVKNLSEQPYKIKAGVLDFWIPTYLYIRRLDYSLFGANGVYIPEVNMEFFDLLKKHPSDFTIKGYSEDGVKLAFYNQYRKFINVEEYGEIKGDKFIETVKPFLFFYKHLNEYAKHTKKFDHVSTLRFRDVLAAAKDPEKAFFEDLPEALGYDRNSLNGNEFIESYCVAIQRAVRELRYCYRSLIDRIESQLIKRLELEGSEYSEYIIEIRDRLSHIKEYLLSDKQRDFYNHAMAEFDSRQEWYQSICYAALDQPLERLRDEQEEQLIDNLVYLFRECEKHSVVSEAMSYVVDDEEKKKSGELESKIEAILSDDRNLDVYVLLNILKKKMK